MSRPKGSKDKKPQHKWTDEEKEYINVYGWDKTKEQDSVDSDFFDYHTFLFRYSLISFHSSFSVAPSPVRFIICATALII